MTPIAFDAGNPHPMTGEGNVTWLLDGAAPALIDAGVGKRAHVDALAAALQGRALAHVYITHHHADHASGVPALRARWPLVSVWKFAHPGDIDVRTVRDGDEVTAGDTTLRVVHTPGHARDHVCYWHESSRALFGGDMVLRGTTVMIPASRGGDLRAYLDSLERMAALGPARIFPGHGPVIDNPQSLIRDYIAHRRLREQQVRECLGRGLADAEAIAAVIYPALHHDLRPAAIDTVRAHLIKIHDDNARR